MEILGETSPKSDVKYLIISFSSSEAKVENQVIKLRKVKANRFLRVLTRIKFGLESESKSWPLAKIVRDALGNSADYCILSIDNWEQLSITIEKMPKRFF